MQSAKKRGLWIAPLGPILTLIAGSGILSEHFDQQVLAVTALAIWMVSWWMFEIIPLAATALLPMVIFPLLDVQSINSATSHYAHPLIYLFFGGFMLAAAIQRWNLHKRVSLWLILKLGKRASSLVGGFMLTTAFLSMWISNTATAIMMLPIGMAIIQLSEDRFAAAADQEKVYFSTALLLAIAYGANIGGIASLIGSPPNTLFAAFLQEASGRQIGFAEWMLVGIPIAALCLLSCWLLLTRLLFPIHKLQIEGSSELISEQLTQLGPLSRGETMVALVFVGTAAAWIIQPLLKSLWPSLQLSDTLIAITATLVLFTLPVSIKPWQSLLDWDSARKIPWDILLLFGGGLALADGMRSSGLSDLIGQSLTFVQHMPVLVIILATVTLVIFLTEITSNTAAAASILPIILALAISLEIPAELLGLPATLAASLAFMLPVATPPNAVVYGSHRLDIRDMIRAGFLLNILCILIASLLGYWLVPLILF